MAYERQWYQGPIRLTAATKARIMAIAPRVAAVQRLQNAC